MYVDICIYIYIIYIQNPYIYIYIHKYTNTKYEIIGARMTNQENIMDPITLSLPLRRGPPKGLPMCGSAFVICSLMLKRSVLFCKLPLPIAYKRSPQCSQPDINHSQIRRM